MNRVGKISKPRTEIFLYQGRKNFLSRDRKYSEPRIIRLHGF